MEDNLISKKELLELMNISYGQLYRWKRKKLIPEEWFIKKSAYTGQETFFPKDEIIARINKILSMKDDLSLDEIADKFKPGLDNKSYTIEKLKSDNILMEMTINVFKGIFEDTTTLTLGNVLSMYIVQKFMKSGKVSLDEGKGIAKELLEKLEKFNGKNYDIILYRKFGISFLIMHEKTEEVLIENQAVLVHKESINKNLEEIKLKLTEEFNYN